MKRLVAALMVVAVVSVAMPAVAAENVAGTWKWTTSFGGQSRDSTVKLKMDGDKLSGVYVGGQGSTETPIEEATIKDDVVSFKVTRERDGQTQSSEWVAKRQK